MKFLLQVVTFDEAGVSGHLNHKALYFGVSQLKRENKKQGRSKILIVYSKLDPFNMQLLYNLLQLQFVSSYWTRLTFCGSTPHSSTRSLSDLV